MELYKLKAEYQNRHPNGHYFDRDTLKFFGERESEMKVLKTTAIITDVMGNDHECYVLSTRQRPPFGKPIRKYHYFDIVTFDDVVSN